jgi:uncharacterized protein
MEKNHRREFLKKSIIGISGAALIPGTLGSGLNLKPEQNQVPDLPCRLLGRTGIKTSLISMGAGNSNSPGLILAAYNAGIKLFFSATYYGEGNNEKLVGDALKDITRDSYFLGTAVSPDGYDERSGSFSSPFDANSLIKKAELSLKHFGTDHVDFILIPYASKREALLNESLLKTLQELKKQGKTRFVGIATHSGSVETLKQCRKCVPQCTHNLEIPAIMRSYMYAYGYGNLQHAQHTLNSAEYSEIPCNLCESCNVKCISGFDIKERVLDISRLKGVPSDFLVS